VVLKEQPVQGVAVLEETGEPLAAQAAQVYLGSDGAVAAARLGILVMAGMEAAAEMGLLVLEAVLGVDMGTVVVEAAAAGLEF
jgi:hypothetical protein